MRKIDINSNHLYLFLRSECPRTALTGDRGRINFVAAFLGFSCLFVCYIYRLKVYMRVGVTCCMQVIVGIVVTIIGLVNLEVGPRRRSVRHSPHACPGTVITNGGPIVK